MSGPDQPAEREASPHADRTRRASGSAGVQTDLAAFLQRHPWPAHMRGAGPAASDAGAEPIEFLWRFEIDAPLATMWPLLTDTSRFNRALGLPEMHFEEHDGHLRGSSVNAGFVQTWTEVPWQWVHARELLAIRDYERGFARWVRAIYEVVPTPDGSSRFELLVYFGWIPRGWFGGLVLRHGFARVEADYRRVLAELAAASRRSQPSPLYRVLLPALDASGEEQLQAKTRSLLDAGMPAGAVERLVDHLRTADELELARIQPKLLARRWEIEPRELLRLALHATRVGLLDLSWDIVCPHCRGTREEIASLSRIPGESRCDPCDLDFDTRAEASVEVTFRVNASVRKVAQRFWCAAEPARRDHIFVQLELAPGERRSAAPPLAEGLYRMRHRGGDETPRLLELRAGASREPLSWTTSSEGDELRGPNPTFDLHNDGPTPLNFVVERAQWSDAAVRPGDLLSLREFRDIFSEDFLAQDVQLAVGMQTLLFTDMVGSTRFYSTRGDAEAFIQVRRHFAEIFEEIATYDGVVVKTIGDAVMAAFVEAAAAIRASHAIQRRFPPTREDLDIRVRISLNRGSCIAVRFNADIDYFGNAVNLAAKLQGSADAGQIAISTSVHEAPGVSAALRELGVELETLSVDLPALGGEVRVLRWTVE